MKVLSDESSKKLEKDYGTKDCLICGAKNCFMGIMTENTSLYYCKNCGNYFIPHWYMDHLNGVKHFTNEVFDILKLRSYMFFHNDNEFVKIIAPIEKQFEYEKNEKITIEKVENWYPKNFKEKIDYILIKLAKLSRFEGDYIDVTDFIDILFFCRTIMVDQEEKRDFNEQIEFIKTYFVSEGLLNCIGYKFQLSPKAWTIIYSLEEKQVANKNVFVAMKFSEETKELREKIKEGLKGFNVRIMDEIEHNHQIVPEMLYEIRNSRFVVAELSHHNNGAYYEAGYALGLGKEVIHICNKKKLRSSLHFDVAQVNTIFYDSIDEIPEKLRKRIEATIK